MHSDNANFRFDFLRQNLFYLLRLQVANLSTQTGIAPSALATSPGINVYFFNAHAEFPDSDIETLKVHKWFNLTSSQ